MIFNSLQYAAFLAAVLLVYWRLGHRRQNWLLLVVSYIFYGAWDWRFLSLIVGSSVLDYTLARLIDASQDDRRRLALLWTSVIVNLSILGVFKYFGFFSENLQALLDSLGVGVLAPTVDIVLPVGISFYTFQTISYTFDVYRRAIPASRNFLDVAVYVAFFPQLVAGPIERANHFMPQVAAHRRLPTRPQVESALGLLALGLFKKVVLADNLAAGVDEVYADPSGQGSLALVLATYAFAFQIYADFSAYTDMARGSARLLGFELLVNFRQPYLSRNIQEFWRTWHISLSNWLRDYLYIPLGGNRGTANRTSINLMLVMVLGGLWHGASWNFVIWGALHGTFLGVHRVFTRTRHQAPDGAPRFSDLPAILLTFHAACLAWVFFRAETLSDAMAVLGGVLSLDPGGVSGLLDLQYLMLVPILIAIDVAQRVWRDETFFLRWPYELRGAALALLGVGYLIFSVNPGPDFIYFQF